MKNLYRGEINAALLVGAVACTGIAGYSVNEMCGDGLKPFVKEWVLNPKVVGSCAPSSRYVTREIVRCLNVDTDRPLRVLEVGSGTGVCTREITDYLKDRKYSLDAIEVNETFAQSLRAEFKDNKQIVVHQADITKWQPTQQYDVIVSTLPFNLLPLHVTEKVIASFKKWIVPGGRISYVEGAGSSTVSKIFMDTKARETFDIQYKIVTQFKQKYLDKSVLVLRNVPAYYVHHLKF